MLQRRRLQLKLSGDLFAAFDVSAQEYDDQAGVIRQILLHDKLPPQLRGFGSPQPSKFLSETAQQTTIPQVFPLSKTLFAYNAGGGATGFLSEHVGLRFDLRYYSTLSRTQETIGFGPVRLRYWTGTVGVVVRY